MAEGCDFVRRLYRAVAEQDYGALRDLCADDVEWIQTEGLPSGGRYVGPASVIENVFERFRGEWDDWRFEIEDCFEADGRVVVVGAFSGRSRRTGKSFRAATAHLFRLAQKTSGSWEIQGFRQFADTKLIADAQQ